MLARLVRELARRRGERAARRKRIRALKPGPLRTRLVRRQRKVLARERKVRAAIVKLRRPRLNETVGFDGTPCFRGLALMLEDCREHGWAGSLSSADRRPGVPEKYGKLSQLALWLGFIAGKAGFNPANPPGRSTHELRSDGVAYRGPVGRPLAWWQLGLDCTDAETLRSIAARLGYPAFRPYPDGREAHHVNLRANPRRVLRKRRLA